MACCFPWEWTRLSSSLKRTVTLILQVAKRNAKELNLAQEEWPQAHNMGLGLEFELSSVESGIRALNYGCFVI